MSTAPGGEVSLIARCGSDVNTAVVQMVFFRFPNTPNPVVSGRETKIIGIFLFKNDSVCRLHLI
jgi:hypothetical protein